MIAADRPIYHVEVLLYYFTLAQIRNRSAQKEEIESCRKKTGTVIALPLQQHQS